MNGDDNFNYAKLSGLDTSISTLNIILSSSFSPYQFVNEYDDNNDDALDVLLTPVSILLHLIICSIGLTANLIFVPISLLLGDGKNAINCLKASLYWFDSLITDIFNLTFSLLNIITRTFATLFSNIYPGCAMLSSDVDNTHNARKYSDFVIPSTWV